MLIGFIGSPCSGKTTTAAKLFAALKENGVPSEYIAEKARSYIASKKFALRTENAELPEHAKSFSLTDMDQLKIATIQYRAELEMNVGDVLVVTDSCVMNSMLYMTPLYRTSMMAEKIRDSSATHYDVLFICAPVPRPAAVDPNRVHDEAASNVIHDEIETVIRPYIAKHTKVVLLTGNSYERFNLAYSSTLEAMTEKKPC